MQQALRRRGSDRKSLEAAALKNTTKENIAQKTIAELSSVRALRAEIEATAAAEGRRGAAGGALGAKQKA